MPKRCQVLLATVAITTALGALQCAAAASFTYETLSIGGAPGVWPIAINSHDVVVGTYSNLPGGGVVCVDGVVKLIAGSEILYAINDSGIAVGEPSPDHGKDYVTYDIATGTLSSVSVPFAKGGKLGVAAEGINASGEIVGTVEAGANAKAYGFVSLNGTISELLPPQEKQSSLVSINKAGEILVNPGYAYYAPLIYRKGKFIPIAVPGAATTRGTFITDSGAVGGVFTASGAPQTGFVYDKGKYTIFNPAGSIYTTLAGIGPSGQVYGTFGDASGNNHGFVSVSGTISQIDAPNATSTQINGVGTSGTIFGTYTTSQGSFGFIAKCPKKDICTQ